MTRPAKATIVTAAIAAVAAAAIIWPRLLWTIGSTIAVIGWLGVLWFLAWLGIDDEEGGEQ